MENKQNAGHDNNYKRKGKTIEGLFEIPDNEKINNKVEVVGGGGCGQGRGIKWHSVGVQIGGDVRDG